MAIVQSAVFKHREYSYQIDKVEDELSVMGANGLTKVTEWAQLDITVKSPRGYFFHAYLPGIGEVFGTDMTAVILDIGHLIDSKFGVKYDDCFR